MQKSGHYGESTNFFQESTWETSQWIQTGHFQVFHSNRKARWQSGFQLATRLLDRGTQVPWLGLLEDLALWFLENQHLRPAILKGGIPAKLLRSYRDKVIGRWIGDPLARRLKTILAGFSMEEAGIGLAWLVGNWLEEGIVHGQLMVPSQLQTLLQQPQAKLDSIELNKITQDNLESQDNNGILKTIEVFSNHPRSFTTNQIEFIESGKALLSLGQGSGLTLLLKARSKLFFNRFRPVLPVHSSSEEVETFQFTEEDYPTGGYSSITNKGRFESLLPSQLAFWDYPVGKTDLFSWKFARDELWYYSRDENALRQPKLEVVFLFREGFTDHSFFDNHWGFQTLTLLFATLLEVTHLLEIERPHQGLKIRWVFEANRDRQSSGEANKVLLTQLGVLLALRIKEGSHSLESKDTIQITTELEKQSGPKRIKVLECVSKDPARADHEPAPSGWLSLSLKGSEPTLILYQTPHPPLSIVPSGFQELELFLLNWINGAIPSGGIGAIQSTPKR